MPKQSRLDHQIVFRQIDGDVSAAGAAEKHEDGKASAVSAPSLHFLKLQAGMITGFKLIIEALHYCSIYVNP